MRSGNILTNKQTSRQAHDLPVPELMELSGVFVPCWLMDTLWWSGLFPLFLSCLHVNVSTHWIMIHFNTDLSYFCFWVLAGLGLCLCFSETPVILLARRIFTCRWECPCFMGAPTTKTGCHVTFQWVCRFGTRGRWGPFLGIYRIPWMCMGMPGILGWFQCDRGVCLRAGGAHNGLLVGFLQDFPQAACGNTLESRVQTDRSVPILFLCLLLSQLVRTSVDTTSAVVCGSLVDVLAELYLTLGFTLYVQASEAYINHQKQCFTVWTWFLVESFP